jgi:FAD-dependent urate hydroxylase
VEILVAGAGVGGLAVARGLRGAGHEVRVLEQAPAPRTGGAAVTIFSNGQAAAAGVGAPLDGLGGRIDILEFCDPDGKPFARTDLRVLHRKTGFPVATVPRDALLTRLGDGVPVEFGRGVTGVRIDGDRVQVTDTTGGTHSADALIGADGYRSAVRRAVLGDAPARPVGWTSWQGLTRVLPELAGGTVARCVVGEAGLCGLMPAGDGLLQWWFDVPSTVVDRPMLPVLRKAFRDYALGGLLDRLTEADVQPYPHVVHTIPDRWGRGPVTLVGDAAHAFPPSQAQGANQALEDAWLLGHLLKNDVQIFGVYEKQRAKRTRLVSRLATSEVTNRPPAFASRLASRFTSPALAGAFYTWLIRRFSSVLE